MCVTGEKKCVMLLRAYRASVLLVNILMDNIEIDIKEMALMITRTQYDQYIMLRSQQRHLTEKEEYLDQLI
jgi:hypothetical protein